MGVRSTFMSNTRLFFRTLSIRDERACFLKVFIFSFHEKFINLSGVSSPPILNRAHASKSKKPRITILNCTILSMFSGRRGREAMTATATAEPEGNTSCFLCNFLLRKLRKLPVARRASYNSLLKCWSKMGHVCFVLHRDQPHEHPNWGGACVQVKANYAP